MDELERKQVKGFLKRKEDGNDGARLYMLRRMLLATLVLGGGYLGYKYFMEWYNGRNGGDGDKTTTSLLHANNLPARACLITESMCPADQACRGRDGALAGAAAMTSDKKYVCCPHACETSGLPTRECNGTEHVCEAGYGCLMGSMVTGPEAVRDDGRVCCTFGCNLAGELPTRACQTSETLCAASSQCLSYTGSVTQPRAKNGAGVCCGYAGTGKQACTQPL